MADGRSYPSPNAAATRSAGPFYGNGDLSSPGPEVRLDQELQDELDAAINPELQNQGSDATNAGAANHPHQQLAQSVMSLAQHPQTPGGFQQPQHPSSYHQATPGGFQQTDQQLARPGTPNSLGGDVTQSGKPRSKVSRACDECRRKKIRCDAGGSDNDTSSCTGCKKANLTCQYSRTPQKRGPSKGYIRELAERVSSLEGQVKHEGVHMKHDGQGLSRMSSEDIPSTLAYTSGAAPSGLKRTHSMSAGLNDHYLANQRTGYAPQHDANIASELDEGLVSLYYQYIHPTLPFLPDDINVLRNDLANTPELTRNALLKSMESTIRSVQYSGVPDMIPGTPTAIYDLLNHSTLKDTIGIAHVQALLFLTIEANNRGRDITRGGAGRDSFKYLSEAVHEAKAVGIFDCGAVSANGDPSHITARQVYFSMGILDAFMAFANKKVGSSFLPRALSQQTSDKTIMGERAYWLGYAARRMMWMHSTSILPNWDVSDTDAPPRSDHTGVTLREGNIAYLTNAKQMEARQMESFKDGVNETEDPVLAMTYLYWWGHLELHFYPIANIKDLMHLLRRLVEVMSGTTTVNPLTHHFAGFAAHVLFQLAEFIDTREDALKIIDDLEQCLRNLVPHSDSQSYEAAIRDEVVRKRASLLQNGHTFPTMGLEHLANAAVSTTNTNTGAGAQAEPASDGGVAAAAEAAARAAQQHMGAQVAKGELLSREGYLTAFLAELKQSGEMRQS